MQISQVTVDIAQAGQGDGFSSWVASFLGYHQGLFEGLQRLAVSPSVVLSDPCVIESRRQPSPGSSLTAPVLNGPFQF